MLQLMRSLIAPLISLFFLMMGSGLFNTFVSLRLEMEGTRPEMIGMVTSALYGGILIGSLKIDRWIAKIGHIRAFIAFAACLALFAVFQSFWLSPWYWSFLRLLGGICLAGVFIVIESWVLIQSPPNMRGGALSLYLGVLYGALSLGQLFIDLGDPKGVLPYCCLILFFTLSIFPITMKKCPEPKMSQETVRLNITQLVRLSPLGFLGGVISGMVLAVTYGLVPVFAKEFGMSISEVGAFMAVIIFGGFSLQWPIGRWADRGKRRRVIRFISFLTACFSIAIAWIAHYWLLFICGFFFGGFAFTLYPVSMAYTCEKVKENEIIAATGGFVLSYGIGAITGPLLAALAMDYFGANGVFHFLAMVALILGLSSMKTENILLKD